jgi:UPF0042 nucleotide-binding protein
MKIRFISYGHKFYEAEGKAPPYHDFLFNLRDLANPFWIPELKGFHGLEQPIREFFAKEESIQSRLHEINDLTLKFIRDFAANESRTNDDSLTFAFKCTGGKHRSTYFAQACFEAMQTALVDSELELEVEHIDLAKYLEANV